MIIKNRFSMMRRLITNKYIKLHIFLLKINFEKVLEKIIKGKITIIIMININIIKILKTSIPVKVIKFHKNLAIVNLNKIFLKHIKG